MKMFLISDNTDTLTGLRLVGISGVIAHDRFDLKIELDKVLRNKEIGIVVVTENLAARFADIIGEFRAERSLPLIVQIPDRHGSARGEDFISQYLREAVGMKGEV
jgi:V/A-type H+-transporting ATPase subunit F